MEEVQEGGSGDVRGGGGDREGEGHLLSVSVECLVLSVERWASSVWCRVLSVEC